jgi:CDP-diacylglycerol--glycerol-3-phosphate 3-phosphatidyltransferase
VTLANKITLCRVVLIPVFCALVHLYSPSFPGFRNAALLVYLVAASTDMLDGWVARRFNQQTRFGRRLDPLADKLLINLGFVFLAANPHFTPGVPLWLPVLIVLRDTIMVIGAMLLNAFVGPVVIQVRILGKITTGVLMVTMLGALIALPLLSWLVGAATIAILGSCGEYIYDGIRQLKELKAQVHDKE